jgi:hypothetical protein
MTTTVYSCEDTARRRTFEHPEGAGPGGADNLLNAIDYLEVVHDEPVTDGPPQRTLLVHCFRPPESLTADNVRIEGGVRRTPVTALWAARADQLDDAEGLPAELLPPTPTEIDIFGQLPDADRILVVRTSSDGDFSPYRLSLVTSPVDARPPSGFDLRLSSVQFSFKVDCPSDFDCPQPPPCPPEVAEEQAIDYLAKDYASFRRLMLDRLSVTVPDWRERSPADLGVVLTEIIAYAADQRSYEGDADGTEAYLGTARQRVSARRHARLVDYAMHDGCNARALVVVTASADAEALFDPSATPEEPPIRFLTSLGLPRGPIASEEAEQLRAAAQTFEPLHSIKLRTAHNEIDFYTWGDERCCVPRGATHASLDNTDGRLAELAPGDLLVFEEVRGPQSGRPEDADPSLRHPVRLVSVDLSVTDELVFEPESIQPQRVAEVEWHAEDALPFPLCLWRVPTPDEEGGLVPVTVARGNVVLVDHGATVSEPLPPGPPSSVVRLGPAWGPRRMRPYRPHLGQAHVTQQPRVRLPSGDFAAVDPADSAGAAFRWRPEDVVPAVLLVERTEQKALWEPRRDLLESDRFAPHFVVESDEDARARLRFGERVPDPAKTTAVFRVGNGTAGNVGAEAIAHVLGNNLSDAVLSVRNPLPARGGVDPETVAEVRVAAPEAFRGQERAVTVQDYAEVTERHVEVQRAAGTLRWTGSWYTIFVTVDRVGGRPVDADFERELRVFLERFRLAGYDLEIDAPRFVSLDIVLTVCVGAGHARSDVRRALREAFSAFDLPDGRRGFFHPDSFTFGQPVYLSRIIAAAMEVPGVRWVDARETRRGPNRFRRWGEVSRGEWKTGRIELARLEIARVESDPNRPEHGRIEFVMEGGR